MMINLDGQVAGVDSVTSRQSVDSRQSIESSQSHIILIMMQ